MHMRMHFLLVLGCHHERRSASGAMFFKGIVGAGAHVGGEDFILRGHVFGVFAAI